MTKEERYQQFVGDMGEAGYEVEDYRGRSFYEGPSVRVESDELQDVIRAARINVQWDQLGKSGLVIYPC